MNRLPADKEEKLLAILRESGKTFDEAQARRDLAGIIERLNFLDQDGNRPGIRAPWGPLRILAEEAAQTFHHHTGEVLGRTTKGGSGALFVKILADAAGKTDSKNKNVPYTLKKCASAVKETQKALSAKAALDTTGRFLKDDPALHEAENDPSLHNEKVRAARINPARDGARAALLKSHHEGEDDGGWPIIEGYERAPDRSSTVQDRIPPDDLNRLIAENVNARKKPNS